MFNMDETHVTSKINFTLYGPNDCDPLICSIPAVPHITAAITLRDIRAIVKSLTIFPKETTLCGT